MKIGVRAQKVQSIISSAFFLKILAAHILLVVWRETVLDQDMEEHYPVEQFPAEPFSQTVVYVSRFKMECKDYKPETMIARIWDECLGLWAIPFDAAARMELIALACPHPELKRHIESWQEL